MPYKIGVSELLERPIIRDDQVWEWMNKMTDDEMVDFEKGIKEETDDEYEQISLTIQFHILYNAFKLG